MITFAQQLWCLPGAEDGWAFYGWFKDKVHFWVIWVMWWWCDVILVDVGLLALASLVVWCGRLKAKSLCLLPVKLFPTSGIQKVWEQIMGWRKVKVNNTKEFETKSLDDKSESNQKVNRLSGLTTNHSMHSIAMINSVKVWETKSLQWFGFLLFC